jgi:hypothetical protein
MIAARNPDGSLRAGLIPNFLNVPSNDFGKSNFST